MSLIKAVKTRFTTCLSGHAPELSYSPFTNDLAAFSDSLFWQFLIQVTYIFPLLNNSYLIRLFCVNKSDV